MVPTIDVSVFAYLTVIGAFLKSAMSWLSTGFDWLYKKCLAVFIGSKFWTFTVCLAIVVSTVAIFASVFQFVCNYILSTLIVVSFPALGEELNVATTFFALSDLISLISFAFTAFVTYAVAINSAWVLRQFSGLYKFIFTGIKL